MRSLSRRVHPSLRRRNLSLQALWACTIILPLDMVDHRNVANASMSKIDMGLIKDSGELRYIQLRTEENNLTYLSGTSLPDLIQENSIGHCLSNY